MRLITLALIFSPFSAQAEERYCSDGRMGTGIALGLVFGTVGGGFIGYQVAKPEKPMARNFDGELGGLFGGVLGLIVGSIGGGVVACLTAPPGGPPKFDPEQAIQGTPSQGVRPKPKESKWLTGLLIGAGVGLVVAGTAGEDNETAALLPIAGAAIGGWLGHTPRPVADHSTIGLSWGGTF